ncbi:hypothetical protein DSL72_001007 [Monilinia vaccinii-corymbosi]|uniref:Ubiquitin-like domain-containing protein n=1 Tax=Monilinia vaccinii-corymbosi TaxID=61207 RepID=A0A8A3P2Z7_9HELO|nr:hypothetical protein DSL72_001007 [Monilinia vaccinii-corymbosi]
MGSLPAVHALSARLEDTPYRMRGGDADANGDGEKSGHDKIRLTYVHAHSTELLDISLRRTIRVPENGEAHGLPPDCGAFPIYSVREYAGGLSEEMVLKGGVFVPIYQREAMWINFKSTHPFAVKIYVGGVNAVSGEPAAESLATNLRRKATLDKGKSIQDYVVTGPRGQLWLDGIAKLDGKVMQFVATSVGNGYSIEAQITGEDRVCGVQMEIIPSVIKSIDGHICVKTLTGKVMWFAFNNHMTVEVLKMKLEQIEGQPVSEQRLVFAGKQLNDDRKLSEYGVKAGSTIHLVLKLRGGGARPDPKVSESNVRNPEMAIAAGGLIKQTIIKDFVPSADWDQDNTLMLNIQMLNADVFQRVVGINAPPTPISADTYARYGYPFYKIYEERSGVQGDFPVQSVARLKALKGMRSSPDDDENISFREIAIDRHGAKGRGSFTPVEEMEAQIRNFSISNDLSEDGTV